MSAEELSEAEAAYRAASARAERAREQRNAAVRQALAAGWTHARISRATGLTRGRIGQIAQSCALPQAHQTPPGSPTRPGARDETFLPAP